MSIPKSIKRWLTKVVFGIGLTSLLSDLSHEAATSILPMFLATMGTAPAALGIIEGASDAISSFSKLASGWYSDRLRKRKPIAVVGYALTAVGTGSFSFALNWFFVLGSRTTAWFGRGIRGPIRDAILTDAIPTDARGKAFGFDRAMDTLGAVLGPITALWLITFSSFRTIFLLTLIPGMLATLSFAFLVREQPRTIDHASNRFHFSLKELPLNFKKFLLAVAVFGMGDFSHTLLILRASQIFSGDSVQNASAIAVSLYIVHNIVYAVISYPAGVLGDRFGKRFILVLGYSLAILMCIGFLLPITHYWYLAILFVIAGMYIAIEDSLERAIAADLIPSHLRGTGFGILATVNGLGDFISSVIVGLLWTNISSNAGFLFSAILFAAGTILLFRARS
ncbi:MAG: MFS transporter [Bacteroidota bacterium]